HALRVTERDRELHVYTDSMYVIDCTVRGKLSRNTSSCAQRVKTNRDLWKLFDAEVRLRPHVVKFFKVKAHTGAEDFDSLGNKSADKLAVAGCFLPEPPPDPRHVTPIEALARDVRTSSKTRFATIRKELQTAVKSGTTVPTFSIYSPTPASASSMS